VTNDSELARRWEKTFGTTKPKRPSLPPPIKKGTLPGGYQYEVFMTPNPEAAMKEEVAK
jgi:hypothetical protein